MRAPNTGCHNYPSKHTSGTSPPHLKIEFDVHVLPKARGVVVPVGLGVPEGLQQRIALQEAVPDAVDLPPVERRRRQEPQDLLARLRLARARLAYGREEGENGKASDGGGRAMGGKDSDNEKGKADGDRGKQEEYYNIVMMKIVKVTHS